MYAKSGGKNGRHNDVADKTNIAALSYITVQVFEFQRFDGGTLVFGNETEQITLLQLPEYAHIQPIRFLFLVLATLAGDKPTPSPMLIVTTICLNHKCKEH